MARPIPTFENFVGQRPLVRYVQKLVNGSRQSAQPLPPLLLLARTGYGKTAFAEALSMALGTSFHQVFASATLRPQDLYAELRRMNFGDLFFVDEAHSLGRDAEQALYSAVDRSMIPALAENGQPGQALESIAEFTLVLATNYPGQVRKALRDRAIQLSFDEYSIKELIAIAQRIANQEKIRLSPQAARLIALTAQGTPRRVYQRLQVLRHFAPTAAEYTLEIVRACLDGEGIDTHGLTRAQRRYLRTLASMREQRSVLSHLAVSLGLDDRFIRDECEHYLVEQGYMEVLSNNSRRLTQQGIELAQELDS
jgi:Holliday junction DNA helicase RuvB